MATSESEYPDHISGRVLQTAYDMLTAQQQTLLNQALEQKHPDFPVTTIGKLYPRRSNVRTHFRQKYDDDQRSCPSSVSVFKAKDKNGNVWTRIAVPKTAD
jgi:hypothetical protein